MFIHIKIESQHKTKKTIEKNEVTGDDSKRRKTRKKKYFHVHFRMRKKEGK